MQNETQTLSNPLPPRSTSPFSLSDSTNQHKRYYLPVAVVWQTIGGFSLRALSHLTLISVNYFCESGTRTSTVLRVGVFKLAPLPSWKLPQLRCYIFISSAFSRAQLPLASIVQFSNLSAFLQLNFHQ
jgi:hypothetical protein